MSRDLAGEQQFFPVAFHVLAPFDGFVESFKVLFELTLINNDLGPPCLSWLIPPNPNNTGGVISPFTRIRAVQYWVSKSQITPAIVLSVSVNMVNMDMSWINACHPTPDEAVHLITYAIERN